MAAIGSNSAILKFLIVFNTDFVAGPLGPALVIRSRSSTLHSGRFTFRSNLAIAESISTESSNFLVPVNGFVIVVRSIGISSPFFGSIVLVIFRKVITSLRCEIVPFIKGFNSEKSVGKPSLSRVIRSGETLIGLPTMYRVIWSLDCFIYLTVKRVPLFLIMVFIFLNTFLRITAESKLCKIHLHISKIILYVVFFMVLVYKCFSTVVQP